MTAGYVCYCGTANLHRQPCRRCKSPAPNKAHKYGARAVYACDKCGFAHPYGRPARCPSCQCEGLSRFDSIAEYRRWIDLRRMFKLGLVTELRRQVPYPIVVNGVTVGKYVADFVYTTTIRTIIEDVKGVDTPLSRFKRKCVEALYQLPINLRGNSNEKRRKRPNTAPRTAASRGKNQGRQGGTQGRGRRRPGAATAADSAARAD